MQISTDKQYKTRDGREVQILRTDVKGTDYPVVAIVYTDKIEAVVALTKDGKYPNHGNQPSSFDLIEVNPLRGLAN